MPFQYVRTVDVPALAMSELRVSESLLDRDSGASACTVRCVATPPGGGSPEGLHTHPVDQVFYVIRGSMAIEVGGVSHEAAEGGLVVIPAGTPHRNWNGGQETCVHLSIAAPIPMPDEPFARQVRGDSPITPRR